VSIFLTVERAYEPTNEKKNDVSRLRAKRAMLPKFSIQDSWWGCALPRWCVCGTIRVFVSGSSTTVSYPSHHRIPNLQNIPRRDRFFDELEGSS